MDSKTRQSPPPELACSPQEWATRVELACAYRAVDALGWNKSIVYNHITARVPGEHDHFLINPFGLRYAEVTASNLLKVDLEGNKLSASEWPVLKQGFVVHSAVHAARPEIACVIHTHTPAGVAVACQKEGLLPLNTTSMLFTDRIAYHDIEGLTDDLDERGRLARSLGERDVMILRNHGLLACGRSVAAAFSEILLLQTACENQVLAMSGGAAGLLFPPRAVSERVAGQYDRNARHGPEAGVLWAAIRRWMEQLDPGFAG
ncbi:class II aldolase/adducin family protein [Xenophilus azovorans]|uniref:class II aldolase/adducin family protein n=1 Tax=Xenophilus azovorans TaxID=151755 RepID=UPI00068A95D9|nr:class II aldolase/adducin family protein [Xenophilus azovorans]